MIIYKIEERRSYANFPGGYREDVGTYEVVRKIFDTNKEMAKFFSGMCEDYIDNFIFEDEVEANMFCLKLNCDKLADVYNKVKKA